MDNDVAEPTRSEGEGRSHRRGVEPADQAMLATAVEGLASATKAALLGASASWLFLVPLLLVSSLAVPGFATYANGIVLVTTSSIVLVVCLGQVLAVIAGGFDLSVGGVIPLAGVAYAVMTNSGLDPRLAFCVTVLVGVAIGTVNALAIARFKLNALIVTLATLSISGGLAYTVAQGLTISVSESAGALGNVFGWSLPYFVFAAAAVTLAVHMLLQYTIFGRRIYMIGGNREAARLAGVRVVVVESAVYMISGGLAAAAGVMLASQLLAATGGLGSSMTLTSLAAVVLGGASLSGGRGGVLGTIAGVFVLGVLADALSVLRVPTFYIQIVSGVVLLVAIGFGRLQELARTEA